MSPGQYWGFQLSDGSWASGIVLGLRKTGANIDRRIFLAGLLNWNGNNPPEEKEIKGSEIIKKGYAHIRIIKNGGWNILGRIEHPETEAANTRDDSLPTWGYRAIWIHAENKFIKRAEQVGSHNSRL